MKGKGEKRRRNKKPDESRVTAELRGAAVFSASL
jgi:hypothetical protein